MLVNLWKIKNLLFKRKSSKKPRTNLTLSIETGLPLKELGSLLDGFSHGPSRSYPLPGTTS